MKKDVNKNAPVFASGNIIISAKPEKVWAVLTDINNWGSWMKMVSKSKLNGDLKENTTFDWKASGTIIHSTLHTVEPYNKIGWTGKAMSLFAIHNWTFVNNNGTTAVYVEESMEGLIAKLFKNFLQKSLKKDMDKSLEMLKMECENY